MYHVVSTGVSAIILYLISYFFSRAGFYSLQYHRKFWNIILAITFLLAASAGILLALQITYKWNIPFIKSVLKWHVECGIGLAFTGIFHFIWHLSYFSQISGKSEAAATSGDETVRTSRQNTINLIIIGFVSSSVQVLLIREIMNIAGGYELITGTFLGSWLIGSAAGAAMARRSSLNNIRRINLYFSLGPLVTLILLLTLSRLFLNAGETPSFFLSLIITLLALFPFCFIAGFTFIKLINYAEKSLSYRAGKSFSIETAGGIIAGITVSILTAGLLNTYQLLILILILNLTYMLLSFFISSKIGKIIIGVAMTIMTVATLLLNPDIFFRQQLLHGIKVNDSRDTPYGNITTGEYGGEKSIYYNQRLQSYSNDEIEREENIHYAMLQHDNPEYILIISGDIKSHLKEVMKYNIKKVVYVERDPALISPEIKNRDSLSKVLTVINDDAFRYIKKTKDNFDVVILLLPPPSTLLLNRFYTTEFFSEVKNRIGKKGVFICSPGSGENYYSKESVILYSSICNSLKSAFRNVRPIVGNKLYLVSSDAEISSSVCSLSEKKGIKNIYVNSDYLSDDLMGKKSAEVMSVIDPGVRQNTFGFPVACFQYQSYNLSKNLNETIPSVVLLVLIFIFPLFSIKRKNLIMFSSAAALSGFEIVTLLVLQTAVGNMYMLTGLIIASLMTGLAIGSGLNLKRSESALIRIIALLLVIFYICAGLLFNKIPEADSYFISAILLLIFIFIPSVLTGLLFSIMTNRKEIFSDPSSVYSADLVGSALGFVIVSGLAIPALGIRMTIILLSTLIFAALLFGTIRSKTP
jgi:spermidine synthase